MGRILFVCGALILFGTLLAISGHDFKPDSSPQKRPRAIVSLAPAITETLFALGLGDKVAGVTEFCAWPPDTAGKPRVGGFREVNLEAIARSGADLVVLPLDMAHFRSQIEELGIRVMLFDYGSPTGFFDSVVALGSLAGCEEQAEKLVRDFRSAMIAETPKKRPRVLFALLNPDECGRPISEMTIIGADKFYNGLIRAAGGENAYTGALPFPRISLEAVYNMDPDVIVVGAPGFNGRAALEKMWRDAARPGRAERLLILNDPGDTIPGPRSIETLKKLKQAISAAAESD